MLILGIETSCDDTAVAIVEASETSFVVRANIISSQIQLHAPYGGIVPMLAAREHEKNLPIVLAEALAKASATMHDIDLIAVTSGPGLIMSLVKGVNFAKELAGKNKKPLIGVNHIEGHIYSNWLRPSASDNRAESEETLRPTGRTWEVLRSADRMYPALCLIVSGGHTELVLMHDHGKYELVGRTVDDAAGEAFDKIARILGLGFPGGPAIAAEAAMAADGRRLSADPRRKSPRSSALSPRHSALVTLPRPMMDRKDFDFSFAGLKTSVLYLVQDLTNPLDAKKRAIRNQDRQYTLDEIRAPIAYEAQEAIVDVLIAKTLRAARARAARFLLLAGGVSANLRLRKKMIEAAQEIDIPLFFPPLEYTTDNAAMIAATAYFKTKKGKELHRLDVASSVEADANWQIA